MIKKYEIVRTGVRGVVGANTGAYRIRALVDIPGTKVKAGDLGGFVETEYNLSHEGTCWVYDDAKVCGGGRVEENAVVAGNAVVRNGKVKGHAIVGGNAEVWGRDTVITDFAKVLEHARIMDFVTVQGNARIYGNATLHYDVTVQGNAGICGDVVVSYGPIITGEAYICNAGEISGGWEDKKKFEITSEKQVFFANCGGMNINFYSTKEGILALTATDRNIYTLEELLEMSKDSKYRDIIVHLCEAAKATFIL